MKRRNWKGHHRSASRGRKGLGPFAKRTGQSKRRSWTFEKLEDRYYFSATPLQTASMSSDTPEGAAAILFQEQQWQVLQSLAMQSGGTAQGSNLSEAGNVSPTWALYSLDPLFASQWHLKNTGQEVGNPDFQHLFGVAGQDINVVPVWDMVRDDGSIGYTGKGVLVAVLDSGVQITHPDLAANISPTLRFNAITGTNNPNPNIVNADEAHGTEVSGLIGAVWNNGEGGSGVAPGVTLVPIRLIAPGVTEDSILQAFQYSLEHGVDITNNSWGPSTSRAISTISTEMYQVFRDSVVFGRDGKGMINVFASGNGGGPGYGPGFQGVGNWSSASYNPYVNSRFVIGVTGVDHDGMYANADGTFTTYPEVGANVLVAAPTGSNAAQNVANDTGQGSGIWTTDLRGDFGSNAAPLPSGVDRDRDPLDDPDYTQRFNGTSAAAPLVSGVIALMLEANPNLTFRDVQEILVRSARSTAWYESPGANGNAQINGFFGAGTASTNSGTTASTSPGGGLASPGGGLAAAQDFGDAPGYAVASHDFDTNSGVADPTSPRLGLLRDAGPTVLLLNNGADDDLDQAAFDDEDGVTPTLNNTGYQLQFVEGKQAILHVNAPVGGKLNVWVDWNRDLVFNNTAGITNAERVFANVDLVAGDNTIGIPVPPNVLGNFSSLITYARFRITTQQYVNDLILAGSDMTPDGNATNGEVEDYQVTIDRGTTPPTLGGSSSNFYTTWQTNQAGPFREIDPFITTPPIPDGLAFYPGDFNRFDHWENPLANPKIVGNFVNNDFTQFNFGFFASTGNDEGRQSGHYELMPAMFANSAGYTVSQGFGAYGDQVGYAHGVIDAELAVQMALQWDTLRQNLAPQTEKTYTTFVLQPGLALNAAIKMGVNGMLVPGGMGDNGNFKGYYDQYLTTDPPGPFPTAPYAEDHRGDSYIDFSVPQNQQINVESVEVKVSITGDPSNLDFVRIMLTSPDGTQSELNDYFADPAFLPSFNQSSSAPDRFLDPGGNITNGTFVWTFNTNRNWGESTNAAVIINPITGDPVLGPGDQPIYRNWEIHIENYGASTMVLSGLEVVWHGKPVAGPSQTLKFDPAFPNSPGIYQTLLAGQNAWDERWLADGWEVPMAQRIQGSVGTVEQNGENQFNFDRYLQELSGTGFSYDDANPRADDIFRRPDYIDRNGNGIFDAGTDTPNQGEFAANVVVSLYRVNKATNVPEVTPTAHFLTGADGNFYFDVDPTYSWVVRITDPEDREKLTDVLTPGGYKKDFRDEWLITPDWFFAPDHVSDQTIDPDSFAFLFDFNQQQFGYEQFKPGSILYGANDANGDGVVTDGPMPYLDMGLPIPMAVKNINFLLKNNLSPDKFSVSGSVYADLNSNGVFDGNDAQLPNITVYVDANRNGAYEDGETSVFTNSLGEYTLPVPSIVPGTFSIGVRLPGSTWQFKAPGTGVQDVTLPGPQATANFGIIAPINAFPDNQPPGAQGLIMGVVFNDLNTDGIRNFNEPGFAGVTVFIDANNNGTWDPMTEASAVTASNGSYVLANVPPANGIFIDVSIANEYTDDAPLALTTPTIAQDGHRVVSIGPGGVLTGTGVTFGVLDRTSDDWGDLLNQTLAGDLGPHHRVVPGFQLGNTNSGEVNGTTSADSKDDASDDGVSVVGANLGPGILLPGILAPGFNTLHVTVFGVGGLLTGWLDLNGDDEFDPISEKITWMLNGVSLGQEADLNPGPHDLQIKLPASDDRRLIAARFRWGEPGLGPTGGAQIGEVEDYFFPLNSTPGDFSGDNVIDTGDFVIYQMDFQLHQGQTGLPFQYQADANGDGKVDQADKDILQRIPDGTMYPIIVSGAGAGGLMVDDGATQNSSPSGGGLSIDDLTTIENSSSTSTSLPDSVPQTSQPTSNTQAAIDVLEQPSGTTTSSAAASSPSGSSLLTSFVVDAGQSSSIQSTSTSVVRSSSVSSDSSNSDLLLLDQTWANTVNSSFDDDHASLYDDESHETVCMNDLALAAVLNEDDEWWNAI